ncbi:MAG: cisplatin damage response ATP-dependent DNA ligase, partial [Burkholderiales bacterium]
MRAFAALYAALDASTSTNDKVDAMCAYFAEAAPADAAWAVYFLAGGRPRRVLPTRTLREAAQGAAGLPAWLFEESYQAVGDLAETIAHLLPGPAQQDPEGLDSWVRERVLRLRDMAPEQQHAALVDAWRRLDWRGRFLFNKLITGGMRVGVARGLVVRALAQAAGLDPRIVAQRMVGYVDRSSEPDANRYLALIEPGGAGEREREAGFPYPFFLASPLQDAPESLGAPAQWLFEWKWDGIRAQVVRRADDLWIWSRGEELVTERYPEVCEAARALPAGTVLDGELLAWRHGEERPLPFAALQTRIGRRRIGAQVLGRTPVVFVAYDLLELEGRDLRASTLCERRAALEALLASRPHARLRLSERLAVEQWSQLHAQRERARARGVEGLMVKRLESAYGIGRTRSDPRGDWWKWKVDPLSVDAVL